MDPLSGRAARRREAAHRRAKRKQRKADLADVEALDDQDTAVKLYRDHARAALDTLPDSQANVRDVVRECFDRAIEVLLLGARDG